MLKGRFQGGLTEATTRLLGHRPGGCPTRREPRLPARSRLLLTLLSPPEQRTPPATASWATRAVLQMGLQLWNPVAWARRPAGAARRRGRRA